MVKADLEVKAAKCFDSFDTYWRKLCAFRDDYLFFEMYMKRNSKSNSAFESIKSCKYAPCGFCKYRNEDDTPFCDSGKWEWEHAEEVKKLLAE